MDPDGVRTFESQGAGLRRTVGLVAVGMTVIVGLLLMVRGFDRGQGDDEASPAANERDSNGMRAENRAGAVIQTGSGDLGAAQENFRRVRVRAVPKRDADSSRRAANRADAGDVENAPPSIDAEEYIAALRAAGETGGIAAFPPPGTNPPKPGVLVPEDYELPEGFVRHYQNTDDGRQLAAILALSPEYDLLDENGEAVSMPVDRIVPPEFAPPDLRVKILEVPAARDPR